MSSTVPFGKYKGQPVEDMLADAEYMAWLEAQPWFRERYGNLLAKRDQDAMSRTPIHNRLQALFLDKAYCQALLARFPPTKFLSHHDIYDFERNTEWVDEQIAKISDVVERAQWQAVKAEASAFQISPIVQQVRFESGLADVEIFIETATPSVQTDDRRKNPTLYERRSRHSLRVEIKPTVADEYPAVLRQMDRHKTSILFIGRYEGEGATEAQFVAMFAASGKTVVFKRDVDAAVRAI